VILKNIEKADFETVETFKHDIVSHLHILDLKEDLKKITIVKRFIQNKGIQKFEDIGDDLLKKMCILIGVEFADIFFEDVRILRKEILYVEVYS